MKKWFIALLCIIMAGMVLSGCASGSAGNLAATAAPIVTNSPRPTATAQAGMSSTAAPQASPVADHSGMAATAASMTPAEADRLAERIEEAVERISEVDDTEVAVSENRALVGVEFEDQYKAGLDARMKKLITDAVQGVDKRLTKVEITDDGTLYGQIKGFGERVAKATGLDELASDFGELWNRMTGM